MTIKRMLACCLDAVAHGGFPQDRAASLIQKLFGVACPMPISTSSSVPYAHQLIRDTLIADSATPYLDPGVRGGLLLPIASCLLPIAYCLLPFA
ncbi:MAG: hypothetical protein F6K44_06680 [Moorea sp. SIO3E2]|nr:hypothetical protein [Moorena sp. SIO3E2]